MSEPRAATAICEATAAAEREAGRSIKDKVEVSASGRVRQTALRAAEVRRSFRAEDGTLVARTVPGSFFEFITRRVDADGIVRPGAARSPRSCLPAFLIMSQLDKLLTPTSSINAGNSSEKKFAGRFMTPPAANVMS